MTTTTILFLVASALVSGFLGLALGRLLTIKGLTWTLKDALGVALVGSFVAVIFILFWKEIPAKNEQLIVYMLGQLSGFTGGVISAHYVHKAGEEKQEAARQETLQRQAEATVASARAVEAAAGGAAVAEPGALKPGDTVTLDKPEEDRP